MSPLLDEPTVAPVDFKPQVKTVAPQLVAPEPEHCPGPESNQAGKTDACAGCPNQQICATATPKGPDPDIPLIAARLASVKHKILVLSGKGGVGKSTFAVMLARGLATVTTSTKTGLGHETNGDIDNGDDDGDGDGDGDGLFNAPEGDAVTVGLMDADICGPSIPKMVGVETETIHISGDGLQPVWAEDNLCVMSVQFMLPGRDDAVVWRGAKKNGLIKKFLRDVEWGELDYLVVDTPPGTSDEHLTVAAMLREAANLSGSVAANDATVTTPHASKGGLDGAILVTTPQEVSLLDVRKEIDFCRKAGIRILGLVENMSGFVCPNCRHETQIFRPSTGGAEKLAKDTDIRFLGKVPLDPKVGMACDYGESLFENFPESKVCGAIGEVVKKILEVL